MIDASVHRLDEGGLRALVPRVLAGLLRRGEDFDAAEDALQEALLEALRAWPEHPPRDPRGWLTTADRPRLLYLVCTAGHAGRVDLAGEAIRLARQVTARH